MTVKCKVCGYHFSGFRTHCPVCNTLSVKFAGKHWSTRIDGIIHKPTAKARNAFPVEQNLSGGLLPKSVVKKGLTG